MTELATVLRHHAIRPTRQRLSIAAVLLARPQHLSADQVLAAVRHQGERVAKATVYNTLGLFARQGLVREVFVDTSRVFYDSTVRPHHHIYNVDSGALVDLEQEGLELGDLPPLPTGTVVDGVDIIIRVRDQRVALSIK